MLDEKERLDSFAYIQEKEVAYYESIKKEIESIGSYFSGNHSYKLPSLAMINRLRSSSRFIRDMAYVLGFLIVLITLIGGLQDDGARIILSFFSIEKGNKSKEVGYTLQNIID